MSAVEVPANKSSLTYGSRCLKCQNIVFTKFSVKLFTGCCAVILAHTLHMLFPSFEPLRATNQIALSYQIIATISGWGFIKF